MRRAAASSQGIADRQLLIFLGLILFFGFIALISASSPVGYQKFGDQYFFVKRQLMFGIIPGILLFLFIARRDYHKLEKLSYILYAFVLGLLVLVFIPGIGIVLNGSRSWLSIGPLNLQPSEFAKFGVIIMSAYLLSRRQIDWENWQQSLVPILGVLAPSLLLVLAQPDVGTLSILTAIVLGLLFLGGVPWKYLALFGLTGVVAFVGLVAAAPYRAQRITTFLHPELDPKGVGYHINQAFLAVGSGGFWGLGYGHSRQKFQYLPEVDADSIYAVIAEENGFLIAAGFIGLVVLLGWRGFKIAKNAPDDFGRFLVSGVTIWFLTQSFLNIGAMVGAMPLTGVPLPLVSHGGSAMIAMLAGWGIVASVSRQTTIS
jgi:cell division protein FtsW